MYVVHTEVMPVAVLLQWLRCARPLVKVYRARLFVRAVPVSVRPESRLLTEWSGAVHRLAPILFQLSLVSGMCCISDSIQFLCSVGIHSGGVYPIAAVQSWNHRLLFPIIPGSVQGNVDLGRPSVLLAFLVTMIRGTAPCGNYDDGVPRRVVVRL